MAAAIIGRKLGLSWVEIGRGINESDTVTAPFTAD